MAPGSENGAGNAREWWLHAALFLLALLMALKYFPGLENAEPYAGNVFQAIYPGAFPGDPYIGPERPLLDKPFQLSLFYVLVKLGGEIWLDDRFVAIVYLGLAFVALIGIDRIVSLACGGDMATRLAAQLILMRDHGLLKNQVFLSQQMDVYHGTFAIPIAVWLIYATLARKSLWLVLALSALLVAVSIKNAPYLVMICLIIVAIQGSGRERAAVGGLFVLGAAVAYYGFFHLIPLSFDERVKIWELMLHVYEGADANPFHPFPDMPSTVMKNAVFILMLSFAMFVAGPKNAAMRGMRVFVALGLALWLVGGLYFTFAPDALKLPQILPFSFVRSLRWPQTVAYLAIMTGLFHWLMEEGGAARIAATAAGVLFLLVIGPANHFLWAGLFAVSGAAVFAGHFAKDRIGHQGAAMPFTGRIAERKSLILAQALALTIAVAFISTIATKRLDHWLALGQTGLFGASDTYKWSGVAEYLRANTPPDAVVLPIEYDPEKPGGLISRRHLGSRSGRTIPIITTYSSIFSTEGNERENRLLRALQRVHEAILAKRWSEAEEALQGLPLVPDYLVLPVDLFGSGEEGAVPFQETARMGGFVILRRKS